MSENLKLAPDDIVTDAGEELPFAGRMSAAANEFKKRADYLPLAIQSLTSGRNSAHGAKGR